MAWIGGSQVVEVVVKGVCEGQAVINVFHFRRIPGSPDQDGGTLSALLDVFRTRWRDKFLNMVGNNYTVSEYLAYCITGRVNNPRPQPTPPRGWSPLVLSYGDQDSLPGTGLDVGALGGDKLPTLVAGSMKWVPGQRVRWGRSGSRYYVGVEADTDTNRWNAILNDIPTKMVVHATSMLTDWPVGVGGQLAELCVFGRRSFIKALGNVNPFAFTSKIVQGKFSPFVSSQVSRKERVNAR